MVKPDIVVEAIRESRAQDPHPLSVLWVSVPTGRGDFARDLKRLRGNLALVPHVLRRPGGFVDPNAVMNDVSAVLDRVRDDVRALNEVARERRGIDLVIVSRTALSLADTSSPIELPEWFPVEPGKTATVSIDDLTWSAAVVLSDEASELDDLRRILCEVDRALLDRLQKSQRLGRPTQSLWDRMGLESTAGGAIDEELDRIGKTAPVAVAVTSSRGAIDEELDRIGKTLGAIRNPTGYRPSASKNPTVVGRLWAHANRTAPDGLPKAAKALAAALGAGDVPDDSSLAAVLNRPPNRIDDAGVRWCLALIVTLRIACQLATAAAHADDYPRFSAVLLRATSRNLRQFLDRAVEHLRRAPAS